MGGAVRNMSNSKKRKSDADEEDDGEESEVLRLTVAPALKKILVEDHKQITSNKCLLQLPR